MMTKTGTVAFSAPEIFTQKFYDEKIDVWSAGIVLYMMLCGEQPFYSDQVTKSVHKITSEDPGFKEEAWSDISLEASNLIKLMLAKNPGVRPDAEMCLEHEWFHDSPFANAPGSLETQGPLHRTTASLASRQSMKRAGTLSISQFMPVQTLLQDILKNGIDLRGIE